MKKWVQVGEWMFELRQVRAIRAKDMHLPYNAGALITIANGEANVENLFCTDDKGFKREDFRDIETFMNNAGFEKAEWKRFDPDGKIKR